MSNRLWGIDLGGTKIEAVVLGPDAESLARQRLPTEADGGYDHILDRIATLVGLVADELGERPSRLGIGTPGTLDPANGTMRGANTTALNGRRLHDDLERRLGISVALANDANCFALAEATLGAAAGLPTVFGVILGTGVGGGIVAGGRVLPGRHGSAGEWGHSVLDPDGAPCYCGKRGCVETILSGPALERFYADRTGTRRPLREIVAKAHTDDAARATVERLTTWFGQALAPVINLLDPHAVVLGGGVGQIDALYGDEARSAVAAGVFTHPFTTPILRPTLGDSAGVFGAALLTADLP